jgi:molybdopterin converting factor small subunit
MKITVEVSSWFKKYTDGRPSVEIEAKNGITAAAAAVAAGVPAEEVGFVSRSGVRIDTDSVLKDGDVIKIFPFIIGG